MKVHFSEIKHLSYDVAVIGAGAAGLEMANAFKNDPRSIIFIERGDIDFSIESQQEFWFESVGKEIRHGPLKTQEDAEKNLARYTGFGGTLNIWGRIWKPLSRFDLAKWPISYDDLYPFYQEVARYHHVQEVLTSPDIQCKIQKGHETPLLKESLIDLANDDQHTLLLGGTVTSFDIRDQSISGLIVKNRDQEIEITANVFILAAGTIETTRLLLNQPKFANPHLGKYLMDHPKGYCGTLVPTSKASCFLPSFNDHKEFKRGITLQNSELPNHSLIFKKSKDGYAMRFHLEQLLNVQSQIKLSEKLDNYSLPIPVLDWRLTTLDIDLFCKFFIEMKAYLENNGFGSVTYEERELSLDHFKDASHQMGTTRMAKSSSEGIVDTNLKVFGIDNLYIASNSVFPHSGSANPTLTLLALARRLTKHLKKN